MSAVTQLHAEQLDLAAHTVFDDGRFTPIDLGFFARIELKRNKDLTTNQASFDLRDIPANGTRMTREIVLLDQTIVNTLGSMTLLSGAGKIFFQPSIDDLGKVAQSGS